MSEATKFVSGTLYWEDKVNGSYLYGIDPEGRSVFCKGIDADTPVDELNAMDPNNDPDLLEAYDLEPVDGIVVSIPSASWIHMPAMFRAWCRPVENNNDGVRVVRSFFNDKIDKSFARRLIKQDATYTIVGDEKKEDGHHVMVVVPGVNWLG